MRTKLVLGAAILAAGLATSVAQNVYSLNVVGYYNVTAAASGFTLMANQLNTGTNGLNQVLPNATDSSQVLKFANNSYNVDIAIGGAWYDNNSGDPTTTRVSPGEGFFFYNPGASTPITFVGEVPQGALQVTLQPNFTLVGNPVPMTLNLAGNSFPQSDGMQFLSFANNAYTIDVSIGGSWFDNNSGDPVTVAPVVGQGYFIYNPGGVTPWNLNFTVQ
jgi:hypothetical protein